MAAIGSPGSPDTESVHERLGSLIEARDIAGLAEVLGELHPSDVADVVEALGAAAGLELIRALSAELASEALAEMEDGEDRAVLLASLAPEEGAKLIQELADDDATDLIGELEPEHRARILAELPADEAHELTELLTYDEESAGGIMTTELVSIHGTRSAGEAIEEVRRRGREVEDFYTVFVVDASGTLLGSVPLDDLILADPAAPVSGLVVPVLARVAPDTDQEEVGRIMNRYNLVSVPVTDSRGMLLGRITFDDVIDVMEAEQTEDILRLAGVPEEEELRASWTDAVRVRLPWLGLNLIMATLSASVIYKYLETIENLAILALIMPIIAGMGGNAGTQALAVTVRRIALSDDFMGKRWSVVGKEVLVGLLNGLIMGLVLASIVAGLSVLAGADPRLGWVVLFAMWGNLLVAGFVGGFIPTLLDRMGIDPAVASSVFIQPVTDFFGFLLLLGLASALIL